MTSSDSSPSQPDHVRIDPPTPDHRERPDSAANARNERRIRDAVSHRDLTRRTRARTGKPFSRRELLAVGGGAAVFGGAFISLPFLLDTDPVTRPAPVSTVANTTAPAVSTSQLAIATPTVKPTATQTVSPTTPPETPQATPTVQ
nr:hypothetical protein [Chloroflexia bacterium]